MDFLIAYGPIGLFLLSFLAATILPFSSEAALSAAIIAGMGVETALLSASAGNCLACAFNYWLGWRWGVPAVAKLSHSRFGRAAVRWYQKYGPVSLFFTWLPLVGDPLTIVAGIFRFNPVYFAAAVFSTRILRYALLVPLIHAA